MRKDEQVSSFVLRLAGSAGSCLKQIGIWIMYNKQKIEFSTHFVNTITGIFAICGKAETANSCQLPLRKFSQIGREDWGRMNQNFSKSYFFRNCNMCVYSKVDMWFK